MKAIVTNICMIQDQATGKVVVQNRTKNWQGLCFPGGHVEPNESLYESVIREVKEETGLTVSELTLCGVKNYLDDNNCLRMVLCYKTQTYEGKLTQQVGEDEVKWMALSDLTRENTSSGFLDLMPLFLEDKTELYYRKLNTSQWNVEWY